MQSDIIAQVAQMNCSIIKYLDSFGVLHDL
jgi:hypothetical protein